MNNCVSFKLAKLLKEKGFDEITALIYMTNHTSEVIFENINGLKHSDGNNPFVSAPTIAEVIMWFYKKYDIWISLSREPYTQTFYPSIDVKTRNFFYDKYESFKSPEEAYEEAFEYTLNNKI